MPCYKPLGAWLYKNLKTDNGKSVISFNDKYGNETDQKEAIMVPCGQCIGCRLERSRQWATRCIHESSLYDNNCFITLTYDDDHLPDDQSLNKKHFQNFMKLLRKRYQGLTAVKDKDGNDIYPIRFFHAGEYGDLYGRPHYHAILFNFDFDDKELHTTNNGNPIYTSQKLASLWKHGYSSIGDVTFESAAYVARYCLKKVTGKEAEEHYGGKQPEYTTMSRRPGIGSAWLGKYENDVYPNDFVVIRNGVITKPPKYYDKELEKKDDKLYNEIKVRRKEEASQLPDNSKEVCHTGEATILARLKTKQKVKEAQVSQLQRSLG